MADLNIGNTTTSTLSSTVPDYSVSSQTPDQPSHTHITGWTFPNAGQDLGYYKTIPEYKKAIDILGTWSVGMGVEAEPSVISSLENLRGWGKDTYLDIFWNLLTMKKALGDSFGEIIRNDKGTLINLKPLYTGNMETVLTEEGMIDHYMYRIGNKEGRLEPDQVFHLCNDRICNEVHGTGVLEACKWVIDALNEARSDHRIVIHRNVVPVRIIEIDTNDTTQRDKLIAQYAVAIKKGEVLIVPKGTVEIKDNNIIIQDPASWIASLENFFYQAVGVPRVMASSQEFTEAASKVGVLTFEPVYIREQVLFELNCLIQLGLRLKLIRPPSLGGVIRENEQKNTGQTGFQPNEVQVNAGRNE